LPIAAIAMPSPAESAATPPVWIYDTTLRDGAQREGLSLSIEDKLRIAHKLDELGVPLSKGAGQGQIPKTCSFFGS